VGEWRTFMINAGCESPIGYWLLMGEIDVAAVPDVDDQNDKPAVKRIKPIRNREALPKKPQ
jgi:hypothetical protein